MCCPVSLFFLCLLCALQVSSILHFGNYLEAVGGEAAVRAAANAA